MLLLEDSLELSALGLILLSLRDLNFWPLLHGLVRQTFSKVLKLGIFSSLLIVERKLSSVSKIVLLHVVHPLSLGELVKVDLLFLRMLLLETIQELVVVTGLVEIVILLDVLRVFFVSHLFVVKVLLSQFLADLSIIIPHLLL